MCVWALFAQENSVSMEFKEGECRRYYQYGALELDLPLYLPEWKSDWDFDWEYSADGKTPKILSFKKTFSGTSVCLSVRRKLPRKRAKSKDIKPKGEELQITGRFACLEIERKKK